MTWIKEPFRPWVNLDHFWQIDIQSAKENASVIGYLPYLDDQGFPQRHQIKTFETYKEASEYLDQLMEKLT